MFSAVIPKKEHSLLWHIDSECLRKKIPIKTKWQKHDNQIILSLSQVQKDKFVFLCQHQIQPCKLLNFYWLDCENSIYEISDKVLKS